METTMSEPDVEVMMVNNPLTMPAVAKQQGPDAPHRRTPPKKQKRTTRPIPSKSGNTGRETSQIWNHFSKFTAKGGKCRAKCHYCPKTFASESKNGTTTLWTHLNETCHKSPFRIIDKRQSTLKPIKEGWLEEGSGSTERVVYNVEDIRRAIAEFVIIDEQPFRVVEGEGFKKLMAKALPNFELPSRVTIARDCLKIYQEEKVKLKKLIKNQRVCITSDTWTSLQNLTYMVVTAHWIDEQWNLQKKILNFFQTPNHKGETIAKGIEECLLGWGIEECLLDTALKFEKVFTRMHVDDHKYQKYCREINAIKGSPSVSDWKNVKAFVKFLKIFYLTTLKFSGSLYATSNSFFHEFFTLRNAIIKYTKSDDLILVDMATKMKSKLEKYWGKFESMNMLLFVAVVLDPRFKMKYVNFILTDAYGSLLGRLKSEDVAGSLNRLFNHYNGSLFEDSNDNIRGDTSMMSENGDMLLSRWEKHLADEGNIEKKSDLEMYLMDDVVQTKDFNILSWWKASSIKYPVVSKIARDVLSIPISTVASESAFSTGGRILDSYRSSLSPKTVEALICTQQWIRSPTKEYKFQDNLEDIQKVEEEYSDLPMRID